MIPYIISPASQAVTFYLNGKRIAVELKDPRYDKIMSTLALNDEETLKSLLATTGEQYVADTAATVILTYKDLRVLELANHSKIATHRGVKLARSVTEMILRQMDAGVRSFSHIEKFLDKLIQITDTFVAGQLYAFLEAAELPITAEGTFIACKGVLDNYYSCNGNTSTRVLTGTVDSTGRIQNKPGAYISVARADVDTNPERHCSCGLHVGSFSYASGYGTRLLYVEVDPLDVVSVPSDCNEKCRVCAYKIVGELDGERQEDARPTLTKSEDDREDAAPRTVDSDKVHQIVSNMSEAEAYSAAIKRHLSISEGNKVTVSKLRRSVGRKLLLTTDEMFRLCVQLGFNYTSKGEHVGNTLIHM